MKKNEENEGYEKTTKSSEMFLDIVKSLRFFNYENYFLDNYLDILGIFLFFNI